MKRPQRVEDFTAPWAAAIAALRADIKDCIRALKRLAKLEDAIESGPEAFVLERAVLLFIEGLAVKREQRMQRM